MGRIKGWTKVYDSHEKVEYNATGGPWWRNVVVSKNKNLKQQYRSMTTAYDGPVDDEPGWSVIIFTGQGGEGTVREYATREKALNRARTYMRSHPNG
jgi:hypothetical protein